MKSRATRESLQRSIADLNSSDQGGFVRILKESLNIGITAESLAVVFGYAAEDVRDWATGRMMPHMCLQRAIL